MNSSIRCAVVALGVSLMLAPGCSKDKEKGEADKTASKTEDTAEGAAFHEPVAAGLTKAGFKVTEFEQSAARPYKAKSCARGEVDKLDVLLCHYASGDEAGKAKSKLEQFIAGAVTGAVRHAGPTALAVADRNKVDLQGKRINQLLKAFAKLGTGG